MAVPDYVGRYVVKREIARGAFATVALAWDEELESQVAIKILHGESGDQGTDFQARFIEEARLLRRIRSHNVIGVHDVGRLPDGRPYIVMDFADLGTLTRKVAEAAVQGRDGTAPGLDLDCTMALVDAMADGLAAIHRAGVVHRDLKPDNILFQSIGNPLPGRGEQPGPQDPGIARRTHHDRRSRHRQGSRQARWRNDAGRRHARLPRPRTTRPRGRGDPGGRCLRRRRGAVVRGQRRRPPAAGRDRSPGWINSPRPGGR